MSRECEIRTLTFRLAKKRSKVFKTNLTWKHHCENPIRAFSTSHTIRSRSSTKRNTATFFSIGSMDMKEKKTEIQASQPSHLVPATQMDNVPRWCPNDWPIGGCYATNFWRLVAFFQRFTAHANEKFLLGLSFSSSYRHLMTVRWSLCDKLDSSIQCRLCGMWTSGSFLDKRFRRFNFRSWLCSVRVGVFFIFVQYGYYKFEIIVGIIRHTRFFYSWMGARSRAMSGWILLCILFCPPHQTKMAANGWRRSSRPNWHL